MAGPKITLAGQDITNYVDFQSVQVDDTLGQGSGAGSSSAPQGRSSTFQMNTSLGPAALAKGAGQTLGGGGPYLVRQGELVIYDSNNLRIFGGYATKFTDISLKTKAMTTIEGVDYSTSLQRTFVNESFSAQTDIQIITFVMKKYAAWIDISQVTTLAATYTFPIKNFRNVSVEQVLQTIAGITGYLVYVDYYKVLHYVSPASAQTAPFGASDFPDFSSTYPHAVSEFIIDDNSAINRVYFYGGKKQSSDISQDVSPLANGNNKIFVFAFYPRPNSTGNIQITVNGTQQVVGDQNSTGTKNTLKSAGGLCDVLTNGDAKAAIFDVAPAAGATVLLLYRYEYPLVTVITDETSHRFFGDPYLDGFISDQTIFDAQTAVQRSRVVLVQQSMGLVTLKIIMYRPGLQAGMTMKVTNGTRGLTGLTYIIQEVKADWSFGANNFFYEVTLGAWNWNIVDVILKLSSLAVPADLNTTENTAAVTVNQVFAAIGKTDVWTKTLRTQGGYFARAAAVGDGHDAYPGFASITS